MSPTRRWGVSHEDRLAVDGDGTVVGGAGGGRREPKTEAPTIGQGGDDSGLDQGGSVAVGEMVRFWMSYEGRAHRVCRWRGHSG